MVYFLNCYLYGELSHWHSHHIFLYLFHFTQLRPCSCMVYMSVCMFNIWLWWRQLYLIYWMIVRCLCLAVGQGSYTFDLMFRINWPSINFTFVSFQGIVRIGTHLFGVRDICRDLYGMVHLTLISFYEPMTILSAFDTSSKTLDIIDV